MDVINFINFYVLQMFTEYVAVSNLKTQKMVVENVFYRVKYGDLYEGYLKWVGKIKIVPAAL